MIVISLCDLTGNMLKPWARAGYECHAYDIQHSIRRDRECDGINYHWCDVRGLTPEALPRPSIIFAFPPCTNLAVSGAGFVMPKPTVVTQPENVDERIWKASPGPDRANFRSATPEGFAKAVFESNHRLLADAA